MSIVKLIIWDLDGVLWPGSITEGGDTSINSKILNFIKDTENNGIIHSICSKNNHTLAKQKLHNIWDLFIFPSINLQPKAHRIKSIIENCQLREEDVVYIDDNMINLNEAKFYCPAITTYSDPMLFIDNFTIPHGRSRTSQYKILENKFIDKNSYQSNLDFLIDSDINIVIAEGHECLPYHKRIEELVNRSNQLNYTRSRFDSSSTLNYTNQIKNGYLMIQGTAQSYIMRNTIHSFAVFAYDKYGYYGLIGFMSVDSKNSDITTVVNLTNFVFSCRVINMNLEQKCLEFLKEKFPVIMNISDNIDTNINTDYIKLNLYKNASHIIKEKENIDMHDEPYKVILLAHCLGPLYTSFSKHIHKIKTEFWYEIGTLAMFRTESLYNKTTSIEDFPELVVFGAYFEFVFDYSVYWNTEPNLTQGYFNNVVKNFADQIQQTNRKMLVLLPSINDEFYKDIRYTYLYNAWQNVKHYSCLTFLHFPEETDYTDKHVITLTPLIDIPGLRKYSRKTMHDVTKQIDIWIDQHL